MFCENDKTGFWRPKIFDYHFEGRSEFEVGENLKNNIADDVKPLQHRWMHVEGPPLVCQLKLFFNNLFKIRANYILEN